MNASATESVSAGLTTLQANATAAAAAAGEEVEPVSTSGEVIFLSCLVLLITTLTAGGNILVVVAFFTDVKLRSFGNWFILNLALTDLMVGLLIPIYAPYPLLGQWPYGRKFCITFMVIDYIVPLASSWNIALISLDRYISVAYPIMYRLRQSTGTAVLCMGVPWLAGTLVFMPAIVAWEYIWGTTVPPGQCWVDFYDNIPYLLFASTMEFVVPFTVVFSANLLIYINIRRRAKNMQDEMSNNTDLENKNKGQLARDRRTARNLAILVGIYGLTWTPYEICALANPLCGFCVPEKVFEVTFWLLWCNSTINPILYPFLQHKFRVAFTKILTCKNAVAPMN